MAVIQMDSAIVFTYIFSILCVNGIYDSKLELIMAIFIPITVFVLLIMGIMTIGFILYDEVAE